MSKQYEVRVWDITFYKVDEEGEEVLNDDGSVKLFSQNSDIDLSWVSDSVTEDDIEEVTP